MEKPMSELKQQLQQDMKDAMRAKEALRLSTIRMLIAAVKQREIDEQTTLSDTDVLKVINKQIKQRRDSIQQYTDAGRTELAEQEQAELAVLEAYLPAQLSETEIQTAVDKAVADSGASSMKDMGAVMGQLKPQLDGKADMGLVSKLVKQALS
jgi:uncharacterized protein YqeY